MTRAKVLYIKIIIIKHVMAHTFTFKTHYTSNGRVTTLFGQLVRSQPNWWCFVEKLLKLVQVSSMINPSVYYDTGPLPPQSGLRPLHDPLPQLWITRQVATTSKQACLGTPRKFRWIQTGLRIINMLSHHEQREKKTETWLIKVKHGSLYLTAAL